MLSQTYKVTVLSTVIYFASNLDLFPFRTEVLIKPNEIFFQFPPFNWSLSQFNWFVRCFQSIVLCTNARMELRSDISRINILPCLEENSTIKKKTIVVMVGKGPLIVTLVIKARVLEGLIAPRPN